MHAHLRGSVVVALSLAALTGCGRSHVFYDSRELRHQPLQSKEQHALSDAVADRLKNRSVVWVDDAGAEHKVDNFAKLPLPELGALWLATASGDVGGENDVRVRVGKESVPVSVYTALDGSVRVISPKKGSSETVSEALDEDGIKKRFDLESKLPGKWHETELRALADSLALLTPDELAIVRTIPFDRQAAPPDKDPSKAAVYEMAGCRPAIFLYSSGVRSDTFRFVGDPSAPRSAVLHSIVHEIGHAFEQHLAREKYCAAAKAPRDKANELTREGNDLTQTNPVMTAYLKILAGEPAPTDYGNTSVRESFAESFALFHVDPDALKRTNPAVFAWFAANGHVKALHG